MVTHRLLWATSAALAIRVLAPSTARADTAPASNDAPSAAHGEAAEPRVHHAPVATARLGEPIIVPAAIDHPELVRSATLVYRTGAAGELRSVPFQRASNGPYVAIVPGDDVRPPSVSYAIELERTDGTRVAAFATRASMHVVEVIDDLDELRERALVERLGGRRSLVSSSADFVSFGRTTATDASAGLVRDQYYRIEAGYTYRPLRTVEEFSLRGGIVRGSSPVSSDVGLNYAAPTVRLRLDDAWHLEGEFLTSVTEVGFSVGAGGALIVGDPYGSKLTAGFETIEVFGSRFYTRLDIAAHPRFVVAPIVEVSDMPHADRYGVRLLTEMRWDAGAGWGLTMRGGYQARASTSGGPEAGLGLSYAF
jgi:hypothetical protein